jgi:glycosyltransferase involved in cell wall biosynthesis
MGLGRVQRGFERWTQDLFDLFSSEPEVDLTLFRSRGSGLSPRQAVPPLLWPMTHLMRRLPISALAGSEEYKRDAIAFALCLLPVLVRRRFDLIHLVDPPLAVALGQLRRMIPFPGRILFTDGCAIPPAYYPRVDHLHHCSLVAYQGALAAGIHPSHMTLIPCGVHAEKFSPGEAKVRLRQKYQIPRGTFVVLMVSAVKRDHKRIDYAIEELARVNGDVLLWIDGNPESPEIPELAQRLLGSRCRITHVPSEQVPELYQVADVMVHASLEESFGLTIVEALCTGLPVLTHDAEHFRWLVEHADSYVNMARAGALAARLQELLAGREALAARGRLRSAAVRARFGWNVLKPQFLEMYLRATAGEQPQGVGSERAILASKRRTSDAA